MYAPRLQVVSIFDNQHISPGGLHLRWSQPSVVSYPKSTTIYRFDIGEWNDLVTKIQGDFLTLENINLSNHRDSFSGANAEWSFESVGVRLIALKSKPNQQKAYVIRLNQPATIAHLKFESHDQKQVSVFHGGHHLSDSIFELEADIEAPGFTDILIRNDDINHLEEVRWISEKKLFSSLKNFPKFHHIDTPTDEVQAYFILPISQNEKINNYYINTNHIGKFQGKYDPKNIRRFLNSLHSAENTLKVPAKNGVSSTEIDKGSVLNLALMDPNLARLSGLYFTDVDIVESPRYLFISKALDKKNQKDIDLYGYIKPHFSEQLPFFDAPPKAKQMSGISYIERLPQGRVGVFPPKATDINHTVLVDVERIEQNGSITNFDPCIYKKNQAISAKEKIAPVPFFIDEQVPAGSRVTYRLRPIDIFGRVGDWVTVTADVQDLDAPVPPSSLNIQLTQNGFPWTDPAILRNNNLNIGSFFGSFCYEEGQWTQSPDAVKAHVYYFLGSKDQRPKIDEWKHLKSLALSPPKEALAHIKPEFSVSQISLPVAEAKFFHQNISSAVYSENPKDNLELSINPERVELLLDRALLEPNLFKDYKCEINGHVVDISSSTAGLAFSDDKVNCARLIVKGINILSTPTTVDLFLPSIQSLTTSSLQDAINKESFEKFDHVSLIADICVEGTNLHNLSSGSVALDLRYYLNTDTTTERATWVSNNGSRGNQQTVVTQIVGEAVKAANTNNLLRTLVRVRPLDYLKLLLSERKKAGNRAARIYPTFSFGPVTFGIHSNTSLAPSGIDISVDMPEEARYQTASFGIIVEDKLGKLGAPTAPFEVRIIQPPPAPPPPPFPRKEHGQGALERIGYAGIPNRRRESRVALDWEQQNEFVRYDISRALDTSIIALYKSLWMAGKADISTSSVELTIIEHSTLDNGMLKIVVLPDPQVPLESFVSSLKAFSGGRITVRYQQKNQAVDFHHRLVDVKRYMYEKPLGVYTTIIYCLCKPKAELSLLTNADISKTATVSSLPDFNTVLNDDDRLRELADKPSLDSAFGLVNTVPLTIKQSKNFDDLIPSPVSNRYFYRVRAVAKSGSASAWSRVSIPFYGFPPVPEPLSSTKLQYIKDDNWLLTWERPLDYINEVELNIIDLDGHATLAEKITAGYFQNESRFVNSHYLLFDTPIDIASDRVDELENWKVWLDDSTKELPGKFIYREETIDEKEQMLRITGFRSDEVLPLTEIATINDANNVKQQTIKLKIPDRQAAVITLSSSLSGVSFKACAILKYNDITLRSEESNVDTPDPELLQNVNLKHMGDNWLLTWNRPVSSSDQIEIYLIEDSKKRILLASIREDNYTGASHFAGENKLLFDRRINVPTSIDHPNTETDGWQVFIDNTPIPLSGEFIKEVLDSGLLRITGFETDDFIPIGKYSIVKNSNGEILQTINLKVENQYAAIFPADYDLFNLSLEAYRVLDKGKVTFYSQAQGVEKYAHR